MGDFFILSVFVTVPFSFIGLCNGLGEGNAMGKFRAKEADRQTSPIPAL